MADSQDDGEWPPREEAIVQNDNAISIDYVKVYAPILLVLAERANANNIIEILNRVLEGTQSEADLHTVQQWLGSAETENAFADLTPQEINDILSTRIAENNELVKPATDYIELSGVQGYCVLGQRRTRDCITVNNHQYSAKLFEQYYKEKKAQQLGHDGPIIDPYRTEISPELQKYLDNFFARIKETKMRTRSQTKKLKSLNGGKKSRKSRKQTKKTRKSNKKSRKQRRR
jgi:hypothetical protein